MSPRSDGAHAAPPHVLREYALVADGERGALIGPRGDFAWMCFPRWHSDALFCALIGGRGCYSITPVERYVWGGSYEPGTLIWHSRWVTDDAVIESRDALALPASARHAIVLRRVSALGGRACVQVLLDAASRFGREPLRDLQRDERGVWRARSGEVRVCLQGAARARARSDAPGGEALELALELQQGEQHDLVLSLAVDEDPPEANAQHAWLATEAAWRARVPVLERSAAPRDARHALAVLSGLSAQGGGLVAAATTSLPERAREGRNYDYRYAWIRDLCYAGQAFAANGLDEQLGDVARFVVERLLADGPRLKPAYTVTGGEVPGERKLELPGYPGGSDIVGNRVRGQFQLDVFGEALLLLAAAAERDRLDADGRRAVALAAEAIAERWREPDAGIWELDPAPWTHSRLSCAAGLRAVSAHAAGETAARWLALADELVAASPVHASGRWQRAAQDERVDAALLLAGIRGAVPAEDPRTLATLRAVQHELCEDGYCYRYRPDARPLGEAEGAFLLCGYLLALAHLQRGERTCAARWFERSRAACGPPGLFSEEFDVRERQLRGNLPQAFVHALLLESGAALAAREAGLTH